MLKVDNREPDKVFKYLEELSIPYERTTLELGDFEENGVLIERKSVADFIGSIKNGHLFDQLARMENTDAKLFLIISGKFEDAHFDPHLQFTVEQRLGALSSIASRYRVKVLQVENDRQLCALVPKLITKSTDGKTIESYKILRASNVEPCIAMLTSISKIGMKKAEAIKERYPTIVSVIDALKEDTFSSPGIGDELKKNLKDAFGIKKETNEASPVRVV